MKSATMPARESAVHQGIGPMSFINNRWVQAARKAQEISAGVLFARKHRALIGKCVYIDVGARWGLSRRWNALYRIGALTPVMFEPDPKEAEQLRAKMPDAIVHAVELFDCDGDAILHVTSEPGSSSLLEPKNPVGSLAVERRISVKTTTLDAIRRKMPKPDFIKVDAQGAEMKILSGGKETLRDVLCAEVEVKFVAQYRGETLFQGVFDFMRGTGFRLTAFRPLGLFDGELTEGNAFFAKVPTTDEEALKIGLWRTVLGMPTHREYCSLSG